MAQKVVVGGQRLGAGEKLTQELHDYGFATFNLEQDFKSTMAPGVLYPYLKIIGTNHDTLDIDLDSFMRTIPTRGPLFGSFKFQVDIFNVPFRLYNGILHNNPTDIGLNMNQVYLPKIKFNTVDYATNYPKVKGADEDDWQVNNSALEKYLGVSGYGRINSGGLLERKMQCIPELAYYDIFKNYYANKQEEKAYVITPGNFKQDETTITKIDAGTFGDNYSAGADIDISKFTTNPKANLGIKIYGEFLNNDNIYINFNDGQEDIEDKALADYITEEQASIQEQTEEFTKININVTEVVGNQRTNLKIKIYIVQQTIAPTSADIQLTPFALKNIDKMRSKLLSCNELGDEFIIENTGDDAPVHGKWGFKDGVDATGLPYSTLVKLTEEGINYNAFTMNGLCVKTYQSDIFNNWLDSEYIDGENGINAITAIAVTDGAFTLDSLVMGEKTWKLLNRVLAADNTYEGWQEARYGEGAIRKSETPMYVGGMSGEIAFEEVVSSSETNIDGDKQPLGSLGGRGIQATKNGGNKIHVKFDEPGYCIGICSITPRICYSQGNDWDRTELDTLDDLHAPELDGIGFQDLIVEKMAWWNTKIENGIVTNRDSAGKQIAWLDYMTAYDKCYGDFAKADGYGFMVLNRNYDHDPEVSRWAVRDITTYIDPAKYNYAFAYSELDAQNFWCRIHSYVRARRKMAGQQIPNL